MPEYVKGSKEWLDDLKEKLIETVDLLIRREALGLSDDEVEAICRDHDVFVWELCDYFEENCLNEQK